MASQQPIPPTPPYAEAGFDRDIWQRWLEILRKRLVEAYSPDNPPPSATEVSVNGGALGEALAALGNIQTMLATVTDSSAAVGQLRQDAALLLADVEFNNVKVDADLTVVGKAGFNGKAPQGPVTLPANATDLPTAIALVNAIKALLIANGQAQ